MTSAFEIGGQGAPLFPGLTGGLRAVSDDQIITFTQYVRYVLPLDGYVFWLKTASTVIQGSLHIGAEIRQNEDETVSANRVVFTTGEDVQQFNDIAANAIWVGEFQGQKFAFSQSGLRYKAAGLFHYQGYAVYPAMASQLIDYGAQLPATTQIVSNSLPAWLQLVSYDPVWLAPYNPKVTLYPSFAVPNNLPPPYGSVHIMPDRTQPLQAIPLQGPTYTHTQLVQDHVRITLYGLTNAQASDFYDLVLQYSMDTDCIGIMGVTSIHDEKRTQPELGILAMKKTIEFDVSYYQLRVNTIARQLIEYATYKLFPESLPVF